MEGDALIDRACLVSHSAGQKIGALGQPMRRLNANSSLARTARDPDERDTSY
jgi:hypothetical protein